MTTTATQPAENAQSAPLFTPQVDILERSDELQLLVDMPGVAADSIDIEFDDGTLSVRGKVTPREGTDRQYLLREYDVGDFLRTFKVSETVDSERIAAEYRHGVLRLHLPKVAPPEPRKISVHVGT